MTYRSLKTFIKNNIQPNNTKIFDLMPSGIKSKIIFVVGKHASNSAAYLSSIMSACEIGHSHFIDNENLDINKRFLQNSTPISTEELCENAEKILKATKKVLSNKDLLLSIALSFCESEYTIIEMSEAYYAEIKDIITPFAIILAFFDDEKAQDIIDSAPIGTKEIIALSQKDDFDYISSKCNKNGTRITFASANKITVSATDLLGTSFYHYSYLYRISSLDLNNVSLAHLAIESVNILFSAPRPYIYRGLESARPPFDLELYSLSPSILMYKGKIISSFTIN